MLPEIPCLHLDAIDVKIRHVDIPRLRDLRRQASWVDAGTTVMEFVAASMRQGKPGVTVSDAGKIRRQIREMIGDEMDDFALTLDAPLHGDHTRG